jgi:D-3-phosphoglycerate dehydrogenase
MTHRVVIVGRIHKSGVKLLCRDEEVELQQHEGLTDEQMRDAVAEADALLIRTSVLSKEAIKEAKRLKVVARHGVGYDNIDIEALTAQRIPLALVGNVNAVSVAEHTIYLMLACMKEGLAYDRAMREGQWSVRDTLKARDLKGKTLLIVGMGRIGREVGVRARAFGMRTEAYDPWIDPSLVDREVILRNELNAALKEADVVSLHLPLTQQTKNLFGRERIALMKQNAVLLCTARGGLIDETALAEALTSGRLKAAGLDVFAIEPPPKAHLLLKLDNVVLSPHSAALTEECAERMAVISAQNCLDGINGRLDPALVANPEVLGGR